MIIPQNLKAFNSHLRFLSIAVEVTKNSPYPILEMGCGDGSTPFLHNTGRKICSLDSNVGWASKFYNLRNENHTIDCVGNEWDKASIDKRWSLIFVDHAPGERRIIDIRRLSNLCDIMLIHDTEIIGAGDYKYDTIWNLFKYKVDDIKYSAWTTMVTNNKELASTFITLVQENL